MSEEDIEKHVLTKMNGWSISDEATLCKWAWARVKGEKQRGERKKGKVTEDLKKKWKNKQEKRRRETAKRSKSRSKKRMCRCRVGNHLAARTLM